MTEALATDQAFGRTQSTGRGALAVGGILLLAVIGLLMLLLIGVTVGPVALAFGFLLATLPAPLYLWIALRVDRFEPEPRRLLGWAFFWGATAATFIAFILNTAGGLLIGSEFGKQAGEIYTGSISAPIVEELAKAAVLFAIYKWRRAEFDGILDGIVYAAMVGLGFAMTENVLYYGRAAMEGGVPVAVVFFVRGVMSPFTHPVFTAMTGIGLGVAAGATGGAKRAVAPLLGLFGAMFLHSLWNTSTLGGATFFGVYLLVMMPIFIGLIAVVGAGHRKEGRLIATYLQPEFASGVLTAGDGYALTALRDRRQMRRAASRDGGQARTTLRDWVMTATELAFLRHRVARGLPTASSAPAAEDAALVGRLAQLRGVLSPGVLAVSQAAAQRAAGVAASGGGAPGAAPAGQPATEWTPYVPGQPVPGQTAVPARSTPPAQPAAAPANWYADPWRQARWRWWDGSAWTHHVAN